MGSLISRNGLISLFFLGLMMFGISSLVGTDGGDGLLMKAARDYTGEAETSAPRKQDQTAARVSAPAPAPAPEAANEALSEFYDDDELIDSAQGYDPTPARNNTTAEELDSDEAIIVQEAPAASSPGKSIRERVIEARETAEVDQPEE